MVLTNKVIIWTQTNHIQEEKECRLSFMEKNKKKINSVQKEPSLNVTSVTQHNHKCNVCFIVSMPNHMCTIRHTLHIKIR